MESKRTLWKTRELFIFIICLMHNIYADSDTFTPRTYLAPRSINTYFPFLAAHNTVSNKKQPLSDFSYSAVATTFYQESTNDKQLSRYFFLKDELLIKGAEAAGEPDISATWLGIAGVGTNFLLNAFESTISIKPTMQRYGMIINPEITYKNKWVLGLFIPFLECKTTMKFKESAVQNNLQSITELNNINFPAFATDLFIQIKKPLSATDAFIQPSLITNKIHHDWIKQGGFGDIELQGKINLTNNLCLGFAGIIPTSQHHSNEYLLDPSTGLGYGGKWGGSCFIQALYEPYNKKNIAIQIQAKAEARILSSSTMYRTFDVTSFGPLSRYMLYTLMLQDKNDEKKYVKIPGTDLLSLRCTINPMGEFFGFTKCSMHVKQCCFGFDLGIQGRQMEKIRIKQAIPYDMLITDHDYNNSSGLNAEYAAHVFNSPSINKHVGTGQYTNIIVNSADIVAKNAIKTTHLDHDSATQPAQLSFSFGIHGEYANKDNTAYIKVFYMQEHASKKQPGSISTKSIGISLQKYW